MMAPGGPIFDVISRKGELVDWIQIPPRYNLVGFGVGKIVYLSVRDASGCMSRGWCCGKLTGSVAIISSLAVLDEWQKCLRATGLHLRHRLILQVELAQQLSIAR